jgi:hypothetical protein
MANKDLLNRLREYLVLDAIVHGVPWDLDCIEDALKTTHPEIPLDYQRLQKLAEVNTWTRWAIAQLLTAMCRSGFVRALPTNKEGAILPRVENDPVDTEIDRYYFEISNRGKLRCTELALEFP